MTGIAIRAASAALALVASTAFAHHSSRGVYDAAATTEVAGELEQVAWSNPHVKFKIRGRSDSGREALWEVEGASIAFMERSGITAESFTIGDDIKVAGNPSVRGLPAMYVTNILLPDGREIFTLPRATARWSREIVDLQKYTFQPADIEAAKSSAHGIFRVWSRPGDPLWNASYPLTDASKAAQARWNIADSPYVSCIKGMPSIMEQPYPLEFVERDGDVELHIEEYDVVRRIEMGPAAVVSGRPAETWGHSTGRWEGDTLIVTTTGVSWKYFDQTGIPLREETIFVERFAPSADGNRLDYQVTITDPAVFTEPVVLDRFWTWHPGERVKPFNCVSTD